MNQSVPYMECCRVTVRGIVQVQYGLFSEENNDGNLILDMKGKQRTSELVHMI